MYIKLKFLWLNLLVDVLIFPTKLCDRKSRFKDLDPCYNRNIDTIPKKIVKDMQTSIIIHTSILIESINV